MMVTDCQQNPKIICGRRGQRKSTQVNASQRKSTQVNASQRKSTLAITCPEEAADMSGADNNTSPLPPPSTPPSASNEYPVRRHFWVIPHKTWLARYFVSFFFFYHFSFISSYIYIHNIFMYLIWFDLIWFDLINLIIFSFILFYFVSIHLFFSWKLWDRHDCRWVWMLMSNPRSQCGIPHSSLILLTIPSSPSLHSPWNVGNDTSLPQLWGQMRTIRITQPSLRYCFSIHPPLFLLSSSSPPPLLLLSPSSLPLFSWWDLGLGALTLTLTLLWQNLLPEFRYVRWERWEREGGRNGGREGWRERREKERGYLCFSFLCFWR